MRTGTTSAGPEPMADAGGLGLSASQATPKVTNVEDEIEDLLEQVTIDAYGEYEQLTALWQWFDDHARFPFRATVVGAEVDVVAVDFPDDERQGLVAVCRRAGPEHTVSLLDVVPVGSLPGLTGQLLGAYRRWAGAEALPQPTTSRESRAQG